ncbi:cytochrome P450 family protein [Ceratobasidium sp. AG-Ba]|nr:cytochrome P450 family protein [Ceratobasidium sp. AG-Ba]QRW02422.1 cytochrome P450 family protein [Ceratobasidium sp. AG-Ba]
MNWGTSIAWQPYGERHKKARRVMASALHLTAAKSYAHQHYESTLDLIRLILADPENLAVHVNKVTGAFIMRLVYGYHVVENDPRMGILKKAAECFIKGWPRSFWLNYFPVLKHIPAWFPGAEFQILGREGRALRDRMIDEPFEEVLDQVREDRVGQPSYTSRLLQDKGGTNASAENLNLIKWSAGSIFSGRASQTVAVILSFCLEMALHPEIARTAQAEIESVVGRERLPELSDRSKLPYSEAVLLEVLRLWPPAPLAEIEFQGYRIPRGASLYSNIWALLRDPRYYSSPHMFNPTRFMKVNPDPDPRKYIFGFGKRICPGTHVANNSTFVICTGLLCAFDMAPSPALNLRAEQLGGADSLNIYEFSSPLGPVLDMIKFSVRFTLRDQAGVHLSK